MSKLMDSINASLARKAGKEAAKKIAEKLKQQNIECEILVPVGKDWNEDLTI